MKITKQKQKIKEILRIIIIKKSINQASTRFLTSVIMNSISSDTCLTFRRSAYLAAIRSYQSNRLIRSNVINQKSNPSLYQFNRSNKCQSINRINRIAEQIVSKLLLFDLKLFLQRAALLCARLHFLHFRGPEMIRLVIDRLYDSIGLL